MKFKTAKYVFFIALPISILFFIMLPTFCSNIKDGYQEVTKNVILTFGVYYFGIVLIITIYSLFWRRLLFKMQWNLSEYAKKQLIKKNYKRAIYLIRMKYGIGKIQYKTRVLSFGNLGDKDKMYYMITAYTFKQHVLNIINIIFSIPFVFVILLTFISTRSDWLKILTDILQKILQYINLITSFDIKILVAFFPVGVTIIAILIRGYFKNPKRVVKNIVASEDYYDLKEWVFNIREMSTLLPGIIYSVSKNLNYVIQQQELIVHCELESCISNYAILIKDKFMTYVKFDDVPELAELAQLCTVVFDESKRHIVMRHGGRKYELQNLYFDRNRKILKEVAELEKIFFTETGVKKRIEELSKETCKKYRYEYIEKLSNENLEESIGMLNTEQEANQQKLASDILNALELLYKLERFNEKVYSQYFKVSRFEAILNRVSKKSDES